MSDQLKKFPFYPDRLRRNIRPIIEEKGYPFSRGLKSITRRQLYRILNGDSDVTVGKLQSIADELEIDLLDFFKR